VINIYYPVPQTYEFPGGPVWPDGAFENIFVLLKFGAFGAEVPLCTGSTSNDNDAGNWNA
jgi:hypothetical protein